MELAQYLIGTRPASVPARQYDDSIDPANEGPARSIDDEIPF